VGLQGKQEITLTELGGQLANPIENLPGAGGELGRKSSAHAFILGPGRSDREQFTAAHSRGDEVPSSIGQFNLGQFINGASGKSCAKKLL